ncbi:MAG: oxidase [Actinobacteria bacterium]|nr:oxidase [Actinomycetota bacterium]|tara:strand:+ start:336 stop:746 length:411 start_codon:yes stop_codon:yes gene_type:complete
MSQDNHSDHFVVPVKFYYGTFITLLIMTVVTVVVAKFAIFDFGPQLNILIAMLIATFKATLVILFFMGVKWDSPVIKVCIAGSLLFFSIFIFFTVADVETRGDIYEIEANVVNIKSPVRPMTDGDVHSGHGGSSDH